MYELCRRLVDYLADHESLADTRTSREILARRLHAVVDGLSVHVLVGHLQPDDMVRQLDAYLRELAPTGGSRESRHPAAQAD